VIDLLRPSASSEFDGDVEPSEITMTDIMTTSSSEIRAGLAQRIRTLLDALGSSAPTNDIALPGALATALDSAKPQDLWLALAVLTGELPEDTVLLQTLRASRLDGPLLALAGALTRSGQLEAETWPKVEVVIGRVVVDVHHTSRTEVTTGIQRVVRETVRRWDRDHDLFHVAWTRQYRSLRRLTPDKVQWALKGPLPITVAEKEPRAARAKKEARGEPIADEDVVVPWKCTVLVPELPAEPPQARRYHALAAYSGSTTGVIGYDLVPLTCSETSADGMAQGFALYLSAAARFDRLAAISRAAATEYNGWRQMLSGSARSGPEIMAIPLTVEMTVPSEASIRAAHDLITIGTLPVVLAVGSHEPRKNHLALLHAAEMLWREGLEFSLTFVGGHSWKSAAFTEQVSVLESSARPVQAIRALSDELLWAAYRVAYCTVFVSVHEGFGLPVAESLASGTPVITSNFGSMLEIGRLGGSLLVDPLNDFEIADALRRILQQPQLRDRLSAEARKIEWRSWDNYANEAWNFLVDGSRA
jgi:glycosyltransferase involved in cell wall biosynthesis